MTKTDLYINRAIAICAAIFIVILQVASYLDRSILVLHIVEAIPYIVGPLLCFRNIKFGYAICFASGIFWLWSGAFLTTFVRNGFEQLAILIDTGRVERFDILIAVPAAIGTGGMVLFSSIGYLRLPKKHFSDLALFAIALIIITLFFLAIFRLFAPAYLEMFRGILF
jgi:hypothetical protein